MAAVSFSFFSSVLSSPRLLSRSPIAFARLPRPSLAPRPLHPSPALVRYTSSGSIMAPPTDRRPVVISGPSGVGKGTLYKILFQRHPDTFCLSVSHTTRKPRPGETPGQDYHFVTMDEFEALIAEDAFVEHAQFSGNRYGTSKKAIADQTAKGQVVLLDIEMEGVKQVQQQKGKGWDARYVFIAPPSVEVLEKRLRGRGTESEASVQKRLEQAQRELEYAKTPGVHDKIIVNDDLEKAYAELEAFIYGTETDKK